LKRHGPFEDTTIIGTVERLHRPEGEEVGTITVSTVVLERPARVRVELDGHQYTKAIRAHEERRLITCLGTLDREGRVWVLRDPGPLAVLDPPADGEDALTSSD
jgi:hypothetical protein